MDIKEAIWWCANESDKELEKERRIYEESATLSENLNTILSDLKNSDASIKKEDIEVAFRLSNELCSKLHKFNSKEEG